MRELICGVALTIKSASSFVVLIGSTLLFSTIAFAILFENRSSPYSLKIFTKSFYEYLLTTSYALKSASILNLISSGASLENEKPRSLLVS